MPRNTTEEMKEPLMAALFVHEADAHGLTETIRRQEKQGQSGLVAEANSGTYTRLPTRYNGDKREDFEKAGFVFGDVVPGDPLFQDGRLPEGWKVVATDHDLWSHVLDGQGRRRGSMFYKAVWYDRDSFMSLSRRYVAGSEPLGKDYESSRSARETYPYVGYIDDRSTGQRIYESAPVAPTEEMEWFNVSDVIGKQAKEKLAEMFPDHEDVNAYWD